MSQNRFDQACRYAAKMDAAGFLSWLFGVSALPHSFVGWLDTRTLPFPGDPDRSLVLYRMNKLGLGRMPHVASNVVDREGVDLLREWIEKMPR